MKRIIAVMVLVNLLLTASFNASGESSYISDLSCNELIGKIQKARITPAAFTPISPGTLKMEGRIEKGAYEEYLKHINEDIRILIINSGGGCTNEGVKIGLDILNRGLTVVVEGMAGSSAANYIFLAGNKKIISRGFVAFHGNTTALVTSEGWDNIKAQIHQQTKESLERQAVDFEKFFQIYKSEIEETIRLEEIFFGKINVSQGFFDLTQTSGKGLSPGQGYDFDFLVPSGRTLEKWGISGVEGASDVSMAEKLGIKAIYY